MTLTDAVQVTDTALPSSVHGLTPAISQLGDAAIADRRVRVLPLPLGEDVERELAVLQRYVERKGFALRRRIDSGKLHFAVADKRKRSPNGTRAETPKKAKASK